MAAKLSECFAVDPYSDDFRRFAAAVPVVTYAVNDRSADVFAEKVTLGIWETELTVTTPIGSLNIITPLIGRNNVYNVLAAVATGLSINIPLKVRLCLPTIISSAKLLLYINVHVTSACDYTPRMLLCCIMAFHTLLFLGKRVVVHGVLAADRLEGLADLAFSLQAIVAGIEATEVVPGRTEYIDLQQNFQVLVDSANTPGALSRLLEDVRMAGARKIILVFGCEGEEDDAKRPYMGEIAHYKVSLCISACCSGRLRQPP